MIEAELKYYAREPDDLLGQLRDIVAAQHLRYNDQYFQHPSLDFVSTDSEFRIREVRRDGKHDRTILTYKANIADAATQSKSEYEVLIDSPQTEMRALLEAMGFECYIEFEKICEHFEFERAGRKVAATVVSLNEVDDRFVEIETLVRTRGDVQPALTWLREFAATLGLPESDRTTATYEGTVAAVRGIALPAG